MVKAARGTGSATSAQTRQSLVSTATQLFAERGLDAVSLAEITRAAGQRNATALHYHFGGKEGLVQAIFDKHTPRVSGIRGQMLEQLPEQASLAALLPVLIVPLAEQVLDEDGGLHYLMFLAQLMNKPALSPASMDGTSSRVLEEQERRFKMALRNIPPGIRELRLRFAILMIFNSLARYAAEVQVGGFDAERHALVEQQLVASATAVLDFREATV